MSNIINIITAINLEAGKYSKGAWFISSVVGPGNRGQALRRLIIIAKSNRDIIIMAVKSRRREINNSLE